jgi:hypothetical protein
VVYWSSCCVLPVFSCCLTLAVFQPSLLILVDFLPISKFAACEVYFASCFVQLLHLTVSILFAFLMPVCLCCRRAIVTVYLGLLLKCFPKPAAVL